MEDSFEALIASYIATKVGVVENFIELSLSKHLISNLLMLHQNKLLVPAGIGNVQKLQQNQLVRNDIIYWLDRKNNNIYENEFLTQIEAFISYLNESCYAGITGYEFHYSLYEKGAFYRKHLDQFQDNSSRQFSLISYLNCEWEIADGGELCIYQENNIQKISPTNGKTIFFKSNELVHEVLTTQKQRLSITGWLKR
ncbi:2OG-Fe(II) oxygenase [Flavobacterium sp.]|jgi:SM-20-related protein|uniref:2OG-Fe(II) oxygenase n=1 Tax=Flavobacterium sp. TaxID=239 RepID=UPI0037BE7BE0